MWLLSSLGDLQPKGALEQFVTVPCESRIKKIYFSLPKMNTGENLSNYKIQFDSVAKQMLKQKN